MHYSLVPNTPPLTFCANTTKTTHISNHAFTKSTTRRLAMDCYAEHVSIHALAKSATIDRTLQNQQQQVSILTLAKSATSPNLPAGHPDGVSIHALAKSATFRYDSDGRSVLFQSTRSRRARPGYLCAAKPHYRFQSTRSRRARRSGLRLNAHIDYVSIHALAKSATVFLSVPAWDLSFQSTRSRRARQNQHHSLL